MLTMAIAVTCLGQVRLVVVAGSSGVVVPARRAGDFPRR